MIRVAYYPPRNDIPLLCRTGAPQYFGQDRALFEGRLAKMVWRYYPTGPMESVSLWTTEPWSSGSSLISTSGWDPIAPGVFERVWAGGVLRHGHPYPERS